MRSNEKKLFHADWELVLFIQDQEDKNIRLISQTKNSLFELMNFS